MVLFLAGARAVSFDGTAAQMVLLRGLRAVRASFRKFVRQHGRRSVFIFKDTSWTDVSVSEKKGQEAEYIAVDTDVEDATPRCLT
jgi:hypothetical protein